MLVRREVHQALMQPYPERAVPAAELGAPSFDFYPERLANGVECWEDFGFCHSRRAIGVTLWADLSIRLTHYGWHGFAGDPLAEFASQAVEAPAA